MRVELLIALAAVATAVPAAPKYVWIQRGLSCTQSTPTDGEYQNSYQRYWPHPAADEIEARTAPATTYRYYSSSKRSVSEDESSDHVDGDHSKRSTPMSAETSYDTYAKREEDNMAKRGKIVWSSYAKYTPHPKRASPISAETSYDAYAREAEDDLEKRRMSDEDDYEKYGKDNKKRASRISAETSYDAYAREAEDDLEKRRMSDEDDYEKYGKDNKKRASPISAETSYDHYVKAAEDEISKRASPISAETSYDQYVKEDENEISKRAKIEWSSYAKYTPHPARAVSQAEK